MRTIITTEPRPVFIDLEFGSNNGLTQEEIVEEVCALHSELHERLKDRMSLRDWGQLSPIVLVELHDNNNLTAETVIKWPDEDSLGLLAAILDDRWPARHWDVKCEIVGPGHGAWKTHAATFWDHGYQFEADPNWRHD